MVQKYDGSSVDENVQVVGNDNEQGVIIKG